MISPQARALRTKFEVEGALAKRFTGALSPRVRSERERTSTGIHAVDSLLGGGLPVGCISELVGVESSGRTTIATSVLAQVTAQYTAAAWIDVSDTFDPESAALSGVDLRRLLWVRCAEPFSAEPACETKQPVVNNDRIASQFTSSKSMLKGGSPHPRSESHGMSDAVATLLQSQPRSSMKRNSRRVVGTPGAPNRQLKPFLAASPYREEQVPTDRMPTRRGTAEATVKTARLPNEPDNPRHSCHPSMSIPLQRTFLKRSRVQSWQAIEKAVRVTDLLLQAGGFGLLVLDLGCVPPERVWRVPLSTWFRFRVACERTHTTLLLLTQHPCAKASAELVVQLGSGEVRGENVVTGAEFSLHVEQQRTRPALSNIVPIRKSPGVEREERWYGRTAWAVRS